MNFVSLSNSAWQIYPVTVNGVIYYPIYAAGNNISAGYNLEVDFIPMRNLWVTNLYAANVSMIYYSNNTLALNKVSGGTGFVIVGTNPTAVAITPNGQYVYVANNGGTTVSVISTSSNSVVSTITVGSGPLGVAITPNGLYAYVANFGGTTVSVISTSSNSVVATIPVGTNPWDVAIPPNGQYVYVINNHGASVSVISTSSNSVVATIPVGTDPTAVAITPNGQYVYVANWVGTVSVISTSSNSVVTTITGTPSNPCSINYGPLGSSC